MPPPVSRDTPASMNWRATLEHDHWMGVHLAVNVSVATAVLWFVLPWSDSVNPIWAISSMIASSDPQVTQAMKTLRGRMVNALLGCGVGLLFLMAGGHQEWKLPVAIGVSVLLTSYVVRVETMWRQAPITTALVIAASFDQSSRLTDMEIGLRRVGEVLLGCVVGVAVSWCMAKVWRVPCDAKGK